MCEKISKELCMSKVLFLVSPALNSFADKRKGTTGNKIDCAMHHFANAVVSDVQIGAVAGVAALAGRAVMKKQGQVLSGTTMQKIKQIYKAVPKPIKIAAGALIGLSLLVRNYKKGKIEQKYLDRAQFVDHTFTLDKKETPADSTKKA